MERAVVGDAGGEEKPKAKQKSAGRLKELNASAWSWT